MSTYVQKVKTEMKKKAQEQSENMKLATKDFTDHPLLYIALVLSALLSMFAGIAIGLGVRVDAGTVTAKGDLPNIFAALLYGASFPIFFEFGLANWLKKFMMREPDNKTQMFTAASMVVLTFVGTCVTAYSASDVIATAFGFFTSFQEVPESVQRWIVYALPTMLMINVAAGELYRQFSQEAVLRRQAEMTLREAQVDADMEVRLAQMEAQRNIAVHAAQVYSDKARAESAGIGSRRGTDQWSKDRGRFDVPTLANAPAASANTPAPVANYAANTPNYIEDLTLNPTNGQE